MSRPHRPRDPLHGQCWPPAARRSGGGQGRRRTLERRCGRTDEPALPESEKDTMIDVDHVSKRYGERLAVDDLTFTVKPGVVTGFLGPNGAGKSTTMRLILGLDAPTSGRATVGGR